MSVVVCWVAVLDWGLLNSYFVLVDCLYLGEGLWIADAWYFWLVLGLWDFATDVAGSLHVHLRL